MAVKASERENKRAPLNMRTTKKLRDALESEASKADRSLAQEVEARLERSFQEDSLLSAFIGDQTHIQLMIRVVAATIRRIELIRGDRFVDSYATFWHCRNGINEILGTLCGPDFGEPKPEDGGEWTDEERKKLHNLGRRVAVDTLKDFGLVMTMASHVTTYETAREALNSVNKPSPADKGL